MINIADVAAGSQQNPFPVDKMMQANQLQYQEMSKYYDDLKKFNEDESKAKNKIWEDMRELGKTNFLGGAAIAFKEKYKELAENMYKEMGKFETVQSFMNNGGIEQLMKFQDDVLQSPEYKNGQATRFEFDNYMKDRQSWEYFKPALDGNKIEQNLADFLAGKRADIGYNGAHHFKKIEDDWFKTKYLDIDQEVPYTLDEIKSIMNMNDVPQEIQERFIESYTEGLFNQYEYEKDESGSYILDANGEPVRKYQLDANGNQTNVPIKKQGFSPLLKLAPYATLGVKREALDAKIQKDRDDAKYREDMLALQRQNAERDRKKDEKAQKEEDNKDYLFNYEKDKDVNIPIGSDGTTFGLDTKSSKNGRQTYALSSSASWKNAGGEQVAGNSYLSWIAKNIPFNYDKSKVHGNADEKGSDATHYAKYSLTADEMKNTAQEYMKTIPGILDENFNLLPQEDWTAEQSKIYTNILKAIQANNDKRWSYVVPYTKKYGEAVTKAVESNK